MKTPAILILIISVAVFTSRTACAQTTSPKIWYLVVGAEAGMPTAEAKTIEKYEYGGTVRLQYGLTNDIAITLTGGYYHFSPNTPLPNTGMVALSSLNIIPVKAGVKTFISPNVYLGMEFGSGIETKPFIDRSELYINGVTKESRLLLSPSLGYAFKAFDAGIVYENFGNRGGGYGLLSLRLAYGFKL